MSFCMVCCMLFKKMNVEKNSLLDEPVGQKNCEEAPSAWSCPSGQGTPNIPKPSLYFRLEKSGTKLLDRADVSWFGSFYVISKELATATFMQTNQNQLLSHWLFGPCRSSWRSWKMKPAVKDAWSDGFVCEGQATSWWSSIPSDSVDFSSRIFWGKRKMVIPGIPWVWHSGCQW